MRPCERSPDVRRRVAMPVGHSFFEFLGKFNPQKGLDLLSGKPLFYMGKQGPHL